MSSPNARLREARSRHFASAAAAAKALGIPEGTYAGHENGHRGFPAGRAPAYARKFKVSEEWLLYGKVEVADPLPSEDELIEMLAEVQAQLPASLPYSEWPRSVAGALRLRLDTLLRDRSNADTGSRQA